MLFVFQSDHYSLRKCWSKLDLSKIGLDLVQKMVRLSLFSPSLLKSGKIALCSVRPFSVCNFSFSTNPSTLILEDILYKLMTLTLTKSNPNLLNRLFSLGLCFSLRSTSIWQFELTNNTFIINETSQQHSWNVFECKWMQYAQKYRILKCAATWQTQSTKWHLKTRNQLWLGLGLVRVKVRVMFFRPKCVSWPSLVVHERWGVENGESKVVWSRNENLGR